MQYAATTCQLFRQMLTLLISIDIQGREPYAGVFMKKKTKTTTFNTGLRSYAYELICFKLNIILDMTSFHILITVEWF